MENFSDSTKRLSSLRKGHKESMEKDVTNMCEHLKKIFAEELDGALRDRGKDIKQTKWIMIIGSHLIASSLTVILILLYQGSVSSNSLSVNQQNFRIVQTLPSPNEEWVVCKEISEHNGKQVCQAEE